MFCDHCSLQHVAVRVQAVKGFFINHHFPGQLVGNFLFLRRFFPSYYQLCGRILSNIVFFSFFFVINFCIGCLLYWRLKICEPFVKCQYINKDG